MKTMDPPDHHHNGFVATHALRHMMYGFVRLCTMVTRYIIYIIYIHIYIYIIYIYIYKMVGKYQHVRVSTFLLI